MSRSQWKGPYINKNAFSRQLKFKNTVSELPRSFELTAKVVGKSFNVHTGKEFMKVTITNEMVGHKIGEFCLTRKTFTYKKK